MLTHKEDQESSRLISLYILIVMKGKNQPTPNQPCAVQPGSSDRRKIALRHWREENKPFDMLDSWSSHHFLSGANKTCIFGSHTCMDRSSSHLYPRVPCTEDTVTNK